MKISRQTCIAIAILLLLSGCDISSFWARVVPDWKDKSPESASYTVASGDVKSYFDDEIISVESEEGKASIVFEDFQLDLYGNEGTATLGKHTYSYMLSEGSITLKLNDLDPLILLIT